MPSITRQSAMPTVIHTKASSTRKPRVVARFPADPVSAVSRPVNTAESWAAFEFEEHARNCVYCKDPYQVHKDHRQLCDAGHRLAQEVAFYIYHNTTDGETYSTTEEDHKLVRIELPPSWNQVRGLLKAIERNLRHRRTTPFVSMDRTYHVSARNSTPERTRSVKVQQPSKSKPRPYSGEIVDWPEITPKTRVFAEINNNGGHRRGSLYEQDLAERRRNAKRYSVEIREPSPRDRREHRSSGYYR